MPGRFAAGSPARTAGVQPAGPGEQQQQQQRLRVGQRLQAAGGRVRGGGGLGGFVAAPELASRLDPVLLWGRGQEELAGGMQVVLRSAWGGCTATSTRLGRGCCRMSEHVPIVRANNGPVSGSFLALNTIAFSFFKKKKS